VVTSASFLRLESVLRGLAPAVALALAIGTTVPVRAAAPADFEQLIARADEQAGQGRHADALRSYSEAFRAMPQELKGSGVGEFVALAAGNAALEDFRARGDRASLADGRTVLRAFLLAAKGADPASGPASTDAAKERLAEIDALMPETSGTATEPPPTPEPEDGEREDTPPTTQDTAPDRSRLGLGLAVAGGVVVLAGVGLMVAGARQVPWYEAKLESEGWMTTDEGYDQEIADAERTRNLDLGLGAGALVIGLGLGITGAVLLAKSKQRKRAVAVVPVLGRDRAMLGVTARF
jgi:hypothetical protein